MSETSRKKSDDLHYECKAAFLVIVDDLNEEITSKDQLRNGKIAHRMFFKSLNIMSILCNTQRAFIVRWLNRRLFTSAQIICSGSKILNPINFL